MTQAELINVEIANAEARGMQKWHAAEQAASCCRAESVTQFLQAVALYQDAIAEIERRGRCLACGHVLVAETRCVWCQRDNS